MEILSQHQHKFQRLKVIYAVALSLIALTILSSSYLMNRVIESSRGDSRVINLSGRQRMLSQRLTKCALALERTLPAGERDRLLGEMSTSFADWTAAHEGLQRGDRHLGLPVPRLSREIQDLFAEIRPYYASMVQALGVSIVRLKTNDTVASGTLRATIEALIANEPHFLRLMDKITFQFDREAKERVDSMRLLECLILVLGLGVLLIEFLMVFRPSLIELSEMMGILEKRTNDLIETNTLLKGALSEAQHLEVLANSASKAKSDFLANMSHEIRTPMNAIIGMAYLALRTDLDARQREYVSRIHTASYNLLGIVNGILDLSKIEAGKLVLEKSAFDLGDVLDHVATVTNPRAFEKDLELVFRLSPDVPSILHGDSLRLGQVITNLVGNAVKFTERGEIVVSVERAEHRGNRVELRFSVRDTGIGIPEDKIGCLFDDFTQADGTITRKYGGTGLGLAISKRMVELMGGRIGLESTPGEGSLFRFTAWFDAESPHGVPIVVPASIAGCRVLVADDSDTARTVLAEMLGESNFRVTLVSSGHEAVETVRAADASDPFAFLCMDWKMPRMDGLEAARIIKAESSLKQPPKILLVTGFGQELAGSDFGDRRIDAVLHKPVMSRHLNASITQMFSTAPAPGESSGLEEETVGGRLPGMHVLLVEDNEVNRQIAVELLESEGVIVDVAENGSVGVDMVSRSLPDRPYDAVLMDLQMPVMDGLTATETIRRNPQFAALPIIAMTASAMTMESERCLEVGMNDHLSKPIEPELLVLTLARHYRLSPDEDRGARTALERPAPPDASGRTAPAEKMLANVSGISGLDVAGGLRRVANNGALYIKLLAKFAEEQETAAGDIRNALEKGDRLSAQHIAHAMKGVAGNIGAFELSLRAADVEHALRDELPDDRLEEAIGRFSGSLASLFARLRSALKAAEERRAATGEYPPVDTKDVSERLSVLAGLLESSDMRAISCFEELKPALMSLGLKSEVAIFEKSLMKLEFESCLGLVHALGGKIRSGS